MLEEKENTIAHQLCAEDKNEILKGLEAFAQKGKVQDIPHVINLLHVAIEEDIVLNAMRILGQLKYQEAVPYLMNAIQDERYADSRESLLQSCWENGLSYIDYLETLIDIMISSNFMLAFEVHTIITNMTGKISTDIRVTLQEKINEALLNTNNDKQELLKDVSNYLYALEEGVDA